MDNNVFGSAVCDTIYTTCLSLFTQTADPNPFEAHNVDGWLLLVREEHRLPEVAMQIQGREYSNNNVFLLYLTVPVSSYSELSKISSFFFEINIVPIFT